MHRHLAAANSAVMRTVSLSALVLLIAGCAAPRHGTISASDQKKLTALTMPSDRGRALLFGPDALRLGVSGQGTFSLPFELKNRCPFVPVSINGAATQHFLFDTGASLTAIEARTAIRHQLPLFDSKLIPAKARGIGGEESMRLGFAALRLGQLTMHNVPLFVRTHKNEYRLLGPLLTESLHTDILGINPLRDFAKHISIDYPRRRMTISTEAAYSPGPNARVAKLKWINRLPYITLRSGGVSWDALLDTGSSFGVEIGREVAAKLDVIKDSVPVMESYQYGIGGNVDTTQADIRHALLPAVDGLGPTLKDVGVGVRPSLNLIGSYFLQHFRVTLDFSRGLLYLER